MHSGAAPTLKRPVWEHACQLQEPNKWRPTGGYRVHMDHTWEDTGERSHHHLPSRAPRGALRRQASPHGTQSQEWPRLRPESPSESHPPLRGRLQLFYLPPGSPHPWKVSSPDSLVLGGSSEHLPTSTSPASSWWVLRTAPHPKQEKTSKRWQEVTPWTLRSP